MDARGNITNELLGNGVTRSAYYEHNTGLLKNLQANLGAATFQNLALQWDQVGNLEQRKETGNSRNLTENFLYDNLNRLKSSQVVGSTAQTLTFNAIGNITNKSDVGNYSYGAGTAGPHAVTSAGGQIYVYDANGNNTSGDGRTISYTSFDKPDEIIKGSHKVEFEYGPDRSRYRRTDTNSSNGRVTDTLYIGSVEKITNPDGSKEWKRTIGNLVIKQAFNTSGTQTAKTEHYLLKDHLGSPSLIMDKIAQVQQTMDFDTGQAGFDVTAGFASNGYAEHSPGGYSLIAALVTEIVMTFMFLIIILGATDKRAPQGFAPIAIGLALTLIHLISIPITNTSVNPARSTGVALFQGGWAVSQLWLFWLAPIVGAILAGTVYRWFEADEND